MSREPAAGQVEFDLTAGVLCLDFANTVSDRDGPCETDRLADYPRLVEWTRQADLLADREATALRRLARGEPGRAARALKRAADLRETIFRLFAAVAERGRPAPEDLDKFNSYLRRAVGHLRLVHTADGTRWNWRLEPDDLECMLGPVAWSAAELLTSQDLERVRECDASACRWIFLDRSRNRSRRWCDMKVCGNRSKVRRHYDKKRKKVTSP